MSELAVLFVSNLKKFCMKSLAWKPVWHSSIGYPGYLFLCTDICIRTNLLQPKKIVGTWEIKLL